MSLFLSNPFDCLPLDDDGDDGVSSASTPAPAPGQLDLPDDGPGADWRGLSEAERTALSLGILLNFLGRRVGGGRMTESEVRAIGRLEFFQAMWIQCFRACNLPPCNATTCVIDIKNNVFVNLGELFSKLVAGHSFDQVTQYATEAELRASLKKKGARRFPLHAAKRLYLHPLLIEGRRGAEQPCRAQGCFAPRRPWQEQASHSMVSRAPPDTEYDQPGDGSGASWHGLNEAGRLALSLNVILHFLGRRVGGQMMKKREIRVIGRLEFYQALWVQFYKEHAVPPKSVTKCVKAIKRSVLVNLNEVFYTLMEGKSFEHVTKFTSKAALRRNIHDTKPFPLNKAKGLMLQPLLIEVWRFFPAR